MEFICRGVILWNYLNVDEIDNFHDEVDEVDNDDDDDDKMTKFAGFSFSQRERPTFPAHRPSAVFDHCGHHYYNDDRQDH